VETVQETVAMETKEIQVLESLEITQTHQVAVAVAVAHDGVAEAQVDMLEAMVEQEQLQLHTDIKLYAVIKDGYVRDGWLAHSLEEACLDNPSCYIVELNDSNSPQYLDQLYTGSTKEMVYSSL
jgi:hypothetical protein